MVRAIQVSYGKVTKDGKKKNRDKAPIEGVPFKKQSIFYKYLPYWGDLDDVQHAYMVVLEEKISSVVHPYTRTQASWYRY